MSGFVRKFRWITALTAAFFFVHGAMAQEDEAAPESDEEVFNAVENLPDCGDVPPKGGSGRVIIRTKPQKAMVYLGGTKLGLSPIDTAFSSGRYTLTIMLNGEELVTRRLNICPDKTTEIAKELKLPYGSLAIKTDPLKINAKVWVDGQYIGTTRGGVLRVNHLEAGTRVLKVVNGRKTKEMHVDVLPEETVDIDVSMK